LRQIFEWWRLLAEYYKNVITLKNFKNTMLHLVRRQKWRYKKIEEFCEPKWVLFRVLCAYILIQDPLTNWGKMQPSSRRTSRTSTDSFSQNEKDSLIKKNPKGASWNKLAKKKEMRNEEKVTQRSRIWRSCRRSGQQKGKSMNMQKEKQLMYLL